MARERAAELNNRRHGSDHDRANCRICSPRPDRIYEDELWSRRHTGARPKTAAELAAK